MRTLAPKARSRLSLPSAVARQTEHVVTLDPSSVATTPPPRGNWAGNATNNNILTQNGVTADCDAFSVGGVSNNLHLNYDFAGFIPSDAVISKVEVIVRNKHDGASPNPRPGINPDVAGVFSGTGTHEQTAATVGITLADFVWDITGDPAATPAWGSNVWTRALLLALQIQVSARSTDNATVHSIQSWDSVKLRITYVGSPPGTPAASLYTITVSTSGDGAGKVTGPGIDSSASDTVQTYPVGSQVKLVATPNSGSTFTQWDDDASISPVRTIDLVADKLVTAQFTGQPAGDELLIHTGAVLAQDLLTDADPLTKWISVTDPFYVGTQPGYDYASDPYIVRNTGGGDPHVPIGAGSASTRWRRHKLSPGVQDPFDAGVPNDTTRTQLINNSQIDANTFFKSDEGDHNWHLWSHRRHGADSLPFAHIEGSVNPGITKTIQVVQWKGWDVSESSLVIFVFAEWQDGYHLTYNDHLNDDKLGWFIPAPNNTWIRFRFECLWSSNPAIARFALWGDTDGVSEKRLVGPITGHRTIYPNPNGAGVNFSHGPYSQVDQPTQDYLSDYANFQVCAYV